MREGCSYTYPPLSVVRHSFIQLSELDQCRVKNLPKVLTPQHRIRTRVLLVESPKLYPWTIAHNQQNMSTFSYRCGVLNSVCAISIPSGPMHPRPICLGEWNLFRFPKPHQKDEHYTHICTNTTLTLQLTYVPSPAVAYVSNLCITSPVVVSTSTRQTS